MLEIVRVTSVVAVAYTVVAGMKNVLVMVCCFPVTVAMPKAMPLETVTVGVVVIVFTSVVVPTIVEVGAVKLVIEVMTAVDSVTVIVGSSGARLFRASFSLRSARNCALTFGSTARPSIMARLNSVDAERAVGWGAASRALTPVCRPRSARMVARILATGSCTWRL